MLQEYWKEGSHKNLPATATGIGVCLYFNCQDALEFYNQFISRNVIADEPFVGNNMWVTGIADPDGYQLYFSSGTNVPEETTYSQWKMEQPR